MSLCATQVGLIAHFSLGAFFFAILKLHVYEATAVFFSIYQICFSILSLVDIGRYLLKQRPAHSKPQFTLLSI